MKKPILLFAIAAALLALAACDDNPFFKKLKARNQLKPRLQFRPRPGAPGAPGARATPEENPGNAAITFHNKLIEFTKNAREPLSKIVKTTNNSAQWAQRDENCIDRPSWSMVLIGINPYTKIAGMEIAAPSSFSKEEQEFFNSRIQETKVATGELNTIISTLIAYYKAEDYKDDKHKKFLDFQPRIKELVAQVAKVTEEMGARSQEIASVAERERLLKDPLGVYVLNMRDIMGKCRKQMDLLMEDRLLQPDSGTARKSDAQKAAAVAKVKEVLDAADALTVEIADAATKAKEANRDALKDRPQLAERYNRFFERLDDQQGEVRKNMRFAKEWGYIGTKSQMELLGRSVRNVVTGHNDFIDTLNRGR